MRNGIDQLLGVRMGRRVDDFFHAAGFCHAPLIHDDDVFGELVSSGQVVRDVEHRYP